MSNEYNNDYWIDRIANETWRTYNSLEAKNKKLLEFYTKASEEIRKEIFNIAFKIGQDTATLSDLHKYNRLNVLNKNMEKIIRELTEKNEKFSHDNIIEGGKKVYENVVVQLKAEGFSEVSTKVMEEMFKRPWAGDTFSKRLWKNSQKLTEVLNSSLLNGITQGKTFTEIAINLSNNMNVAFNVAHRLVRTETMHYLNESAAKGYEDAGIELVQLWAAEDERTCKTCGALHGKIYKINKRPILGLHPGCRCTYIPVMEDV